MEALLEPEIECAAGLAIADSPAPIACLLECAKSEGCQIKILNIQLSMSNVKVGLLGYWVLVIRHSDFKFFWIIC